MSDPFAGPGPDAIFAERLAAGDFCIQRCAGCGVHVFHPRPVCPQCGSSRLDWVTASGEATVYAKTVIRRRPDRGGDYNVVLVDLAEGPRMMATVEGIAADAVATGMAVRARIAQDEGGTPRVVFVPQGEAA